MHKQHIQEHINFDFLSYKEINNYHKVKLTQLLKSISPHPLLHNRTALTSNAISTENIIETLKRIKSTDPQDHKEMITTPNKGPSIIFSTGGTSGKPKVTLLSFQEVMYNTTLHGKGYYSAGINENDIVATFGIPSIFSSEFTVYHGLEKTGCLTLPIADMNNIAEIVDVVKRFNATVLLVMPSDLIPLVKYLEEKNEHLDNIRLIVTGGEAIYNGFKERVSNRIGKNLKFRSTFQTSDTGTIGFQCPYLADNQYHIHEELQFVEFEKNTNGQTLLVTTNLNRQLMPVIKLKTGDIVKLIDEQCPCGRNSKIIKLLGRVSKSVKIGGEKFDISYFNKVLDKFDIPLDDCAIELSKNERHQDEILVKLNSKFSDHLTAEKIINAIINAIINGNQKLSKQIQKEIISIQLIELKKNTDLKYSTTGKRILFCDTRD